MKKAGWLVSVVVCWSLWTCNAEAGVTDWPVVSQLVNVVRCVISDAGKITTSLVSHATAFSVETLQTVGQCLIYTAGQATGVGDPNPLHEVHPHE